MSKRIIVNWKEKKLESYNWTRIDWSGRYINDVLTDL